MRFLTNDEVAKRGCLDCQDLRGYRRCPHRECPYTDLDGYESFEEFCASFPDPDMQDLFKDTRRQGALRKKEKRK